VLRKLPFIFLALLALGQTAMAQDAAPDREFDRIAEHVARDAPSQDVVDRIYEFMEKYPKDPRSDQLQYWVGVTQQKRKFHHEAIKEFGYLINDFPKSPLFLPALRAQAESYEATGNTAAQNDCFKKIVDNKPASYTNNPQAAAAVRDALLSLAKSALEKKDIDAAIAYYLQLPDRGQAIGKTVELYIQMDRHEDALAAIAKLPEADRFIAYRLTAETYGSRDGVANLHKLLARIIQKEKPSGGEDNVLEHVIRIIAKKGIPEHAKALETVAATYDRLKRWAQYGLCEIYKSSDPNRLRTFVGDYRTGNDVDKTKTWLGAYYEAAGDVKKAQEAYWLLDDKIAAHFLVAETYYGQRAKTKDLPKGEAELTTIVKRFYSPVSAAEALSRRAEVESRLMKNADKAINTLVELVQRFPNDGTFAQAGLMRLGEIYRSQKKQDDAIAAYEKLIIRYPEGHYLRSAWLQIAFCHEEKKEPTRAIEILKSVLRKYPRTAEASTAHTRLENVYKIADTEVSDR
jgi:TolA-binding protein